MILSIVVKLMSRSMSGEGQVMSRKVRLALSSEHYSGKVIYFLFTIQIDP